MNAQRRTCKTTKVCRVASLLLLALLLSACARQPERPKIEEITFRSGEFTLVGDLVLPEGAGPFPVILIVEGSMPGPRYDSWPLEQLLLQDGYAAFAWDAPGIGESTGSYNPARLIAQRAQILLDAIAAIQHNPLVDPQRIGLLASSQGGYVMARALAQTDDVAFAICDSCAGLSGNDQMAYQITLLALCGDPSTEAAEKVTPMLAELRVAAEYDTYEEYLRYREVLAGLADLAGADLRGRSPESKDTWQANPLDPETYWNPVRALEGAGIPILAIYGDRDRQIDPFQGAYAWRQALAESGSPSSRIVVFPGVGHSMFPAGTGCPGEYQRVINQYLQSKGFDPADPPSSAQNEEPYQPGYLSDYPWAPEALDQIHEWLKGLH